MYIESSNAGGPAIIGDVSNPDEGRYVCLLVNVVCCVRSGLCDGLIIHSEEYYRVYDLCVCV
jgi:hypothetical protein